MNKVILAIMAMFQFSPRIQWNKISFQALWHRTGIACEMFGYGFSLGQEETMMPTKLSLGHLSTLALPLFLSDLFSIMLHGNMSTLQPLTNQFYLLWCLGWHVYYYIKNWAFCHSKMLPVVQAFPHKLNTDDWICSTVTAHIQKKTVEKTKQKKNWVNKLWKCSWLCKRLWGTQKC